MPSWISAATEARAPGPESLAGNSGSRAAMGVRTTGGPPPSWDSTSAVVANAPSGTAFDGTFRTSIFEASSLSPNFSADLATTMGTPAMGCGAAALATPGLGIMVLATTRAERPNRAQAPRLTMVTTRMAWTVRLKNLFRIVSLRSRHLRYRQQN